jgi:hypothetical protein
MFTVADIRIHDRPPIVFYIFERQGFRPASANEGDLFPRTHSIRYAAGKIARSSLS